MAEKLPKPTKEDLITAAGVFRRNGDAEKELACLINLWKGRDRRGVYNMIRDFRNHLTWRINESKGDRDLTVQLMGILKRAYILTARTFFDDYMIALEWDRPADRRFWLPRRKILYIVAQDMEALYYGKIKFLGVSLPPRVGKALASDTPVLTRSGWKNHGDLAVGDEVIAPDGRFVKVLAVHPPCEMEYAVEFTNGETIVCHGAHEWRVYNRHRQKEETLETRQMLSDYENDLTGRGHRYAYMIPHRTPVIGEKKQLPVAPYTFGVWLGDGRNTNPDICGAKEDCAKIVPSIIADGYSIAWSTTHKDTGVEYYGFRPLRYELQKIGMCHSRRRVPKYIPEEYLTASLEQRLELLAGLLDTDGTLTHRENRYHFTTAEESLRDSFVRLISTFGWRATVNEHKPVLSSSGIQGRHSCWAVSFNPTMYIPCRLERKQLHQFSKQRKVAIKSIKPVSGKVGNCITVEGGMYCAGRTLIPTHNSTLGIFFMTWVMGNRPEVANLMTGHSDKLTDGFYREILSILTDHRTYNWSEIFPNVDIVDTSAKNETIDLKTKKRFPSFTARSISGTLTGAVEVGVGGILYCDDLVEDLEEALNPDRLDAKYQAYLNQLKDRKKDGALELMVGTRWNVFDPLGRIEEQYRDNPDYRFRVIPALNSAGKSNFDYPYKLGFTTTYYEDMKASIEDSEWAAKYMGSPYIREGLLYAEDTLRRFYRVPEGDPDAIWAICDPAQGGGDDTFLPIFYQYGDDHYLVDCVCTDALPNVADALCAEKLVEWKVQQCQYEINAAGGRTADAVADKVREMGGGCSITKRHTQANKETKILANSTWVKDHILFLDAKMIPKGSMYEKMVRLLTLYTLTGKNQHDDVPDGLAQYALFIGNRASNIVTLTKRFF